jgi:SAM-dependent methyltransferase
MDQTHFEWTLEFWQGWRKSDNPYRQYKSERDRRLVVEALEFRDRDRILEVGCGYGWILQVLWGAAKIEWTGVDHSAEMIRRPRAVHPEYVSRALHADARGLPFKDEKLDKVFARVSSCTSASTNSRRRSSSVYFVRSVCCFAVSITRYLLFFFLFRLWNLRKQGFVQNFQVSRSFRNLRQTGRVQVNRITDDGSIATVPIRIGRFSFAPVNAFRSVCRWDARIVDLLAWLAYEVCFRGMKANSACTF